MSEIEYGLIWIQNSKVDKNFWKILIFQKKTRVSKQEHTKPNVKK